MITALSHLGYDATSLAHMYLGRFSHSSLKIFSSSVRLDGVAAEPGTLDTVQCQTDVAGALRDLLDQRLWTYQLLTPHHCCFCGVCSCQPGVCGFHKGSSSAGHW